MDRTKLFEVGADGGGSEVFRMEDGMVTEIGSSGGFLDEKEFPSNHWVKSFKTFEDWFENFKKEQGNGWIYMYPLYISYEVKPYIAYEVYKYEYEYKDGWDGKANWHRALFESHG